MKIMVNLLDGTTRCIYSSKNDKVINLKKHICNEIKDDCDELIFLFQGIVLNDDDKMIQEYIFESNDCVNLIRRLRAGTKISVKINNKSINFEVIKTDKVIDIKNKIKEKLGTEICHQRLIFDGKTLQDDMVIEDCGIVDTSVITLIVRLQNDIQVIVETLDKRSSALVLNRNDTIKVVKEKIQEKLGIHPDEQKIVFQGVIVNDNATVDYYNMEDKSVLKVVTRLM